MNHLQNSRRPAVRRRFACLAATLAVVVSAPAHPGHGLLEYGAWHAVTSPFHLLMLALTGALLLTGAHICRRRLPRRALQTLGLSALVASAVLWGLRV